MFSPELRAKAEALVDRYPVKRSALLPLLHLVQHQDGYVTADGIAECAELLDLTKAEVGAVATFYTMYKREEMGRHLVSVCTNFSCQVRGGKEVFLRLKDHLGVGHDQTTADGAITLEHAECLGNCEGAPVVTVDYLNYEWVSPEEAVALVEALRNGETTQPTRGMLPPGIRAVSHRLAGLGPIDPDAPGQTMGLADGEDGAVPADDAGPKAAGLGVIDLAGALSGATGNGSGPPGGGDRPESDAEPAEDPTAPGVTDEEGVPEAAEAVGAPADPDSAAAEAQADRDPTTAATADDEEQEA